MTEFKVGDKVRLFPPPAGTKWWDYRAKYNNIDAVHTIESIKASYAVTDKAPLGIYLTHLERVDTNTAEQIARQPRQIGSREMAKFQVGDTVQFIPLFTHEPYTNYLQHMFAGTQTITRIGDDGDYAWTDKNEGSVYLKHLVLVKSAPKSGQVYWGTAFVRKNGKILDVESADSREEAEQEVMLFHRRYAEEDRNRMPKFAVVRIAVEEVE